MLILIWWSNNLPSNDAQCQGSHAVYLVLQEVIFPELHKIKQWIFVAIMSLIVYLSAVGLPGTKLTALLSVYCVNV